MTTYKSLCSSSVGATTSVSTAYTLDLGSFFLEGPASRMRPWRRDEAKEARWKDGQTGVPIVDALMRELRSTGYMSNRGRYVVASYLVFYLGIDWRVGADWFESCLIDHDVCSNHGEWASMANVAVDLGDKYPMGLKGRGPTSNRDHGRGGAGGDPWARGASCGDVVFDPWEQAVQYDRDEGFVRRWVPELRRLPKGQAHRPPDGAYIRPIASQPLDMPKSKLTGKPETPCGPSYGTTGTETGAALGGMRPRTTEPRSNAAAAAACVQECRSKDAEADSLELQAEIITASKKTRRRWGANLGYHKAAGS